MSLVARSVAEGAGAQLWWAQSQRGNPGRAIPNQTTKSRGDGDAKAKSGHGHFSYSHPQKGKSHLRGLLSAQTTPNELPELREFSPDP